MNSYFGVSLSKIGYSMFGDFAVLILLNQIENVFAEKVKT